MGLAATGVWRVPPHPPLQLEDPSLKPKALPSPPSPSLFPHPPWLFLQCSGSPGRGGPVWCGGRDPRGGWRGRALQRHLGPDPQSKGTRSWGLKNRAILRGSGEIAAATAENRAILVHSGLGGRNANQMLGVRLIVRRYGCACPTKNSLHTAEVTRSMLGGLPQPRTS